MFVVSSSVDALSTTGAPLRCEVVTHFDRLEELSAEWERLWQTDPTAEIFQSLTWARTWWHCFGSGQELCTPVVYEGDRVVLILPLVQQKGTIRFLGAPREADYCDVLCSEWRTANLLALALNTLFQSVPGWKECLLENVPVRSRIISHWQELPSELRSLLRLAPADDCPTILFEGKRNEIIDRLLRKKHMQRRQKKLSKAGLLTFRHIETKGEAQEHLTYFFQCQKRRYALLAKTSSFEAPERRRFFQALVEQFDLRNELRFGVLELDGRPLAWSLGFEVNGKFTFYQQTFDVDAQDYAPGEVLLHYLLLYAREKVEREFDFGRGDEFYKARFATHTLQSWNLYFEGRGIGGRVRRLWWAGQGRLHRRIRGLIRRHEPVFRYLHSVRVWKRRTLSRIGRAKENASLFKYLLDSGVNLFRATVWSHEEAALFQMGNGTMLEQQPAGQPSDPKVEIIAGRFCDLVDLSLKHPGVLGVGLDECRRRLKKCDHVNLIREKGLITAVAWTGTRDLPELLALRQDRTLVVSGPTITMYEYQAVPCLNLAHSCRQLLLFLASEATGQNRDLLVCCSATQPLLRAELERQGFLPKYRIVRRRFLHWMRHDSIRAMPAIGGIGLPKNG